MFVYLGFFMNSCSNIKRMLQFEQDEFELFKQRFKITHSASQPDRLLSYVMGTETLGAKIRFAWLHYIAEQQPEPFKEMYGVYAKMLSVMVALFDTA